MASKQQNLDFVLEQLSLDGVTSRKMFGEYAVYYRERIVALFCDDQLFVKPTNAGRTFIGKVSEGAPYPGAKPWFFISGDRCEDGEWLSELVRLTASELPPPKLKPLKPKSVSSAKSAKRPSKIKSVGTPPKRAKPNAEPRAKRNTPSSQRLGKSLQSAGVQGTVIQRGAKRPTQASPKRRA